ncbi:unnamed protein product [Mytilus edulis]|uniref:C-type lectin domain-containing protein n=1 Tax=Mytilus edulis TaxID=6550 RepID=A0A8S3UG89_MYTED|nr:unnamed protein product [Mytilus edulis]
MILIFVLKTVEPRAFLFENNLLNEFRFDSKNALLDIHTKSLALCSSACLLNDRCASFFFNANRTKCLLHAFLYLNLTAPETGPGWRHYVIEDRIRRCPPWDDFIYHEPLHLCYNINGPIRTDFDVLKLKCRSFGAELIRVDSEEKQQYIVVATSNLSTGHVCMQGTDNIDANGAWTFDDGTVMPFLNWKQLNRNQPLSGKGNLGMDINNGAYWVALYKQVNNSCIFVCERR